MAFTRSQFDEARKRGKKYVQGTSLDARITPTPYAEFHQAPQEVKHARVANVRHEKLPEPKVTTLSRAKESSLAVFLTIELPAEEITSGGKLKDVGNARNDGRRTRMPMAMGVYNVTPQPIGATSTPKQAPQVGFNLGPLSFGF